MDAPIADFSCQIKDRLAARVGPQRFKLWFKNATRFTLTGDFLKIGVPNQFIGGWIERHFADDILCSAREVMGRDVQLSYTVEPQLSRGLGKTQMNSQAASIARITPRTPRNNGHSTSAEPPPRPRGRFDAFVVGPCNRMAYHAALDLAEQRPGAASPLFLHGGCGLGKTHLLHAIANALEDRAAEGGRAAKWAYVSGEEFTNEFLYALKSKQLEAFRQRYRTVDVLLLDDVHFLANKKATQDEFLHTFNAIDTLGKRVVLASDAAPRMIGQMPEALISRFVAGMVIRLDPPDHETRCNILRRRAASIGRILPEDVIQYIAERVRSNFRELEGALLRVVAMAGENNAPLTLALARQALERHVSRSEPQVTAEQIETATATYFGMTAADLHTSRKSRAVALARSIAMYLARKHTQLSYPELGRLMGNKNHATVLLASRRIETALQSDADATWQTVTGPRRVKYADIIASLESPLPV